jgi:hypothetical protein
VVLHLSVAKDALKSVDYKVFNGRVERKTSGAGGRPGRKWRFQVVGSVSCNHNSCGFLCKRNNSLTAASKLMPDRVWLSLREICADKLKAVIPGVLCAAKV